MRRPQKWMMAAALVVASAESSVARIDFGNTAAFLPAIAAMDGTAEDFRGDIETDDNGVWVAVWESGNAAAGVTPGVNALVFSRSVDDGDTWTAPSLVEIGGGGNHCETPSLATDTAGNWVIAWVNGDPAVDDLIVATSSDNGASWSPPTVVRADNDDVVKPSVVTDKAGVWVLAWGSADTLGGTIGGDGDILVSRSVNNGATWSPPAVLNSNAAVDILDDERPVLSTDEAGVWGAVWQVGGSTAFARSLDNAVTWDAPVVLSTAVDNLGTQPAVATDSLGRWVAVWDTLFFLPEGAESRLLFSRSTDNGASWSPEALLHSSLADDLDGENGPKEIKVLDGGLWAAVWTSLDDLRGARGDGPDMTISYSRDGGMTWSSPAGLTTKPRENLDDLELRPAMAWSSSGRTIVIWDSRDPLNGTIGDDPDILAASSQMDCPAAARNDCIHSNRANGSKLAVKDILGGRDSMTWRLRSLEPTLDADLGDPLTTDSYVLCLYEKIDGAAGLIGEWDARAGGTCAGVPCWKSEAGRVSLTDRSLEYGSIHSLSVRAGGDGEGSIRLRAKGPALAPPLLPLDASSPVRIQLLNLGTNVCWEGVHDQAKTNDSTRFVSTSD